MTTPKTLQQQRQEEEARQKSWTGKLKAWFLGTKIQRLNATFNQDFV